MYCGGVDPEEFLWAHADRVKAVHYKDMKITGQEAPLGKGMVDLKACFQFARANGALQIVDMDAATLEDTCRAGKCSPDGQGTETTPTAFSARWMWRPEKKPCCMSFRESSRHRTG